MQTAVEDAALVLHRALSDARQLLGADEVVLWQWDAVRGEFAALGSDPVVVAPAADAARLQQLLAWTVESGLAHIGGADTHLAIAPALLAGRPAGVLSARRPGGFECDREHVRRWLPRSAARLVELVDLLLTRDEYVRTSDQRDVLVDAAQMFQDNRSLDALGTSICEFALRMTRGGVAALVRWDAEQGTGAVQNIVNGDARLVGLPLSRSSLVAETCAGALPRVWGDARQLAGAEPVFGEGELVGNFGSLAIIPLASARGVTGAIAILGRNVADLGPVDLRNLELLAAMSAVSLETLWELDEFTRRARTDQLTGLPNRRAFDEALTPALVLADRYELPLSLIVADIDHFKSVNDTFGHAVGDAVLRSVARTVQGIIRTSDLCARFGGEEIAVLLPNTPQRGAEELAERLRAAVERQPVRAGGQDVRVTASFGVAALRESTTERLSLFEAADAALYEAKAAGRNQVKSATRIA